MTYNGVTNYLFQPIKDDSSVKDVFVLGVPRLASEVLVDLYYNQMATYNEMRLFDKEEEEKQNDVRIFNNYTYQNFSTNDL